MVSLPTVKVPSVSRSLGAVTVGIAGLAMAAELVLFELLYAVRSKERIIQLPMRSILSEAGRWRDMEEKSPCTNKIVLCKYTA